MIVSPTSRMCSAISLASSAAPRPRPARSCGRGTTRPGSAVMRTTMRSESTLVPPVTAERSPPLSRMTGADSPVMADSSTEAMPSMTSPSPGIELARLDDDRVALAQRGRRHRLLAAVHRACARVVSLRILRSVAACALPRPSATASAKLAKRTVNQSQSVTAAGEPAAARRRPWRRPGRAASSDGGEHAADLDHEHDRVLGHVPRRRACAGCPATAGRRMRRIEERDGLRLRAAMLEHLSVPARGSARRSGPSDSAGKKVSAPTITITPTEQPGEERRRWWGRCPGPAAPIFLPTIEPAMASAGTIIRKRPTSMARPSVDVPPGRVGVEAGEGRAVVAGAARERVEDLATGRAARRC